jgi:murein DD-endopeptidase MepM/ murein hydrolase activator NlpD
VTIDIPVDSLPARIEINHRGRDRWNLTVDIEPTPPERESGAYLWRANARPLLQYVAPGSTHEMEGSSSASLLLFERNIRLTRARRLPRHLEGSPARATIAARRRRRSTSPAAGGETVSRTGGPLRRQAVIRGTAHRILLPRPLSPKRGGRASRSAGRLARSNSAPLPMRAGNDLAPPLATPLPASAAGRIRRRPGRTR